MKHSGIRSGEIALVCLLLGLPLAAQKKELADRVSPAGENRIAREVRHQLVMLPYYGVFDNLAFQVDAGTVTLLGQVTQPTLKSQAANVAKGIEGVTRVDNRIQVLPVSDLDWRIRRAEFRSIYDQPGLNIEYGYQALLPIHIIVDNGHVTLVGVVNSEADKNLIGVRANQVPGVFSVTNNLTVQK